MVRLRQLEKLYVIRLGKDALPAAYDHPGEADSDRSRAASVAPGRARRLAPIIGLALPRRGAARRRL